MPETIEITRELARAWTDAGYMTVAEYVRLCREKGWAE